MQSCLWRMKSHSRVFLCCCLLVVGISCREEVQHVTYLETDPVSLEGPRTNDCKIFCSGKILNYVQRARVFNSSKIFVDMKLKYSPEETESHFAVLLNETKGSPTREELEKFVKDNFDSVGSEFQSWMPTDWKPNPTFIHTIYDQPLREFAQNVHKIWKILGRKVSTDVRDSGSQYSQIYVPNPFIVPGGIFRELYYWDSYWIVEGLLLSEMHSTAKGMIENFLYLVSKFGYIPNGTRKYYLGRSQPPFLIPMMNLYWRTTKDINFLNDSIVLLEKEFNFWQQSRTVTVAVDSREYKLFQYRVDTNFPRPESLYNDEKLAEGATEQERQKIYSGLKSAAESGWDFSTRWLLVDGKRSNNLRDINTMSIAPVCLNSIMGLNARLLSEFYEALGNKTKSNIYQLYASESNITMSRIFWSERDGIWLDYNIESGELIPGFYPSNLMPLWAELYGTERSPGFISQQVIAYLERCNISAYPGGIPTSLAWSGQQWDLPMGWAPLQYLVVTGLEKLSRYNPEAKKLAFTFAKRWIINIYATYLNTTPHKMLEKYNVTVVGGTSNDGGGEYQTQVGFGWTNGVALKFLSMYGHEIKSREMYDPVPLTVGLVMLLVSGGFVFSYVRRVHCFAKPSLDAESPS